MMNGENLLVGYNKKLPLTLAIRNAGERADMNNVMINKLIGKRAVEYLKILHCA